jgi:hypothetical protein
MTNLTAALIAAIAMVESGGDPSAINKSEDAYGMYQIRQCVLNDVLKSGHFYTLEEMLNPTTAERVLRMHLTHWGTWYECKTGKDATQEILCRIWSGGVGNLFHKPHATDDYWEKIKEIM